MKAVMTLQCALTFNPRVMSYDAHSETPADVVIERFYRHFGASLLDSCVFSLAVIRKGKLEESMMFFNYEELEQGLIKNVHGGREIAISEHWTAIQ
jgi:hypothetical protein